MDSASTSGAAKPAASSGGWHSRQAGSIRHQGRRRLSENIMMISYKLPLAFDAEFLKADLGRICADEWVAHFNKEYYEGEWKGLALRSTTGKAKQLYRAPDDSREAIGTAILERCQYFKQVLGSFKCPILTARLLSLSPGSKIREHEDYFLGFEDGTIRIHIPIVTDKRVEFFVGNEKLEMMEGEAWYIDFSQPHSVSNTSDKDRVHLVIDCAVNGWLEGLVPFGRGTSSKNHAVTTHSTESD